MPDYSKGCIYMIKKQDDFNNENIYIGSTCNFIRRKHLHKSICYNENIKNYNYKLYKCIRENGGWDSWVMTKIIDYDCNNKSELNIMERNYIDNYKSTLNCYIPTRTIKEYQNDNKEKFLQYHNQYRNDNKDKILERAKKHYEANKNKILEKQKEYYETNKDKISERAKKHYEANKDKILEKVICDNCGCEITKCILAKHKKSKKCLNFNSK